MIQSSLYMANIEQAGALNVESITDVGHIRIYAQLES